MTPGRIPSYAAAILAIVALTAWLGTSTRADGGAAATASHGGQEEVPVRPAQGGSAAPCAIPLAWRVARVDAAFGVGVEEASAAVFRAATLWEEAVGRSLFREDTVSGFPIRLVFEARQARNAERIRAQGEILAAGEELDRRRGELQGRQALHREARDAYERRLRDLEARVAAHNAEVHRWNERGGAPPLELADLEAAGLALERQKEEVRAVDAGLRTSLEEVRREEQAYNRAVGDYEQRSRELAAAFPPESVESGRYQEAFGIRGDRVEGVSREIRIFRFDDLDDLTLVAAHELGHALGLGHLDEPRALMREEFSIAGRARQSGVSDIDVAEFRRVCPGA